MAKQTRIMVALLCVFGASLLYADTGSLQLSLRDVITGYAVVGTVSFNGPQHLTVPTDENGNLSVTLQTGEYIFQASAQGYQSLTTHYGITSGVNLPGTMMLGSTSLPEDERPQQLSQQIRPGFTLLHGYLVESQTGKPIANVRVQLLDANVETETNVNGHYSLSVVTPKEPRPGVMATDTLVLEKSGYDKVIVENFGIGGEDLRLAPFGLQRGNSVIRRDGSHKLSGQSSYEPQSPTQTTKLPNSIYRELVLPGKALNVAGRHGITKLQSIDVPASIRVGMGAGGSLTYVPCTGKKSCASWVTFNLESYVSAGLPAEWYATWYDDSLKAGAVAYRSFGAWYVANPINLQKYDICNTTACQVYDPFDKPSSGPSRAAVQETASVVLSGDNGATILFAEYAADGNGFACPDGYTGEPLHNWPCLADPIAAGTSRPHVHGRGMGQWPSHWWAAGVNELGVHTTPACWQCILDHYYNDNGNSTGTGTGYRTSFLYEPVNPGYGPSPDGLITFTPWGSVPSRPGSPMSNRKRTRPAQWPPCGFNLITSDLYTLNLDGTNLFDVSPIQSPPPSSPQCSRYPSWDPTQQQIAYEPYLNEIGITGTGGLWSIFSLGDDWVLDPAWSRENMIAYFDYTLGGLYSVTPAGGSGNLIVADQMAGDPFWSPTGAQVAYDTCYPNADTCNNIEIAVADANGGGFLGFLTQSGDNLSPAWSPDGTQVVFVSDRTGQWEIWVMQFDGTLPTQLTFNSPYYGSTSPGWSQDGHHILWISPWGNGSIVSIMNPDGSNPMPIGPVIPAGNGYAACCVDMDTTRCRRFDTLSGLPANPS